eukprot:5300430-Ditylum_brightwellii.AAC.1
MLATLKTHAECIEQLVIGLASNTSTVQDIEAKQTHKQAISPWCFTNYHRASLYDGGREGPDMSSIRTELDHLSKSAMYVNDMLSANKLQSNSENIVIELGGEIFKDNANVHA